MLIVDKPVIPDILKFSNKNLKDIVTPVKVQECEKLLRESGYDVAKTQYLMNGFKKGFTLGYQGPKKVTRKAKT